MNKISRVFETKKGGILNIYCTAGFPGLQDTGTVIRALQDAGVDLIEVGMPFSDPIADGGTIQDSNNRALKNGMTISLLFEQLSAIKEDLRVPVILMGYLNPVLQFGMDRFLSECRKCGVSGLIIPDLPIREYLDYYKEQFESYGIENIFLVTPQTSPERIAMIDKNTMSFIYAVSTFSTTGGELRIDEERKAYFEKLRALHLRNPFLIGFGIHDHNTFRMACEYGDGAIIGSAFIKTIANSSNLPEDIGKFVESVKHGS